jgi:hypothetical protein
MGEVKLVEGLVGDVLKLLLHGRVRGMGRDGHAGSKGKKGE